MRDKSLVVSVLALSFLATSLAACGGDDDGATTPDAAVVTTPDAMVTNQPDASTPAGCTSPASITLAPSAQNSGAFLVPAAGANPESYVFKYLTGDVGTQFLQFRDNTPAQVGTALDLAAGCTQGVAHCFLIVGNYQVDATTHQVSGDLYRGSAGTITITEAGAVGGNFKATLSGAQFTHIDSTGAPTADGCKTSIPDTSINVIVMAPMKAAQPGSAPAMPAIGASVPTFLK